MLARTARILNIAGPPCCSDSCRMSGVFGQKLGRMWSAAGDQLLAVLAQLAGGRAPGEVGVRLGEADAARARASCAGRVNASARNSTSGSTALTSPDQPVPEVERLGVRVVDPEDLDALRDPVQHDPQDLGADAVRVVVEVQRIDVLVLLRRVLRVRDRAVGQRGEPLRVRGRPTGGPARTAAPGRARPPARASRAARDERAEVVQRAELAGGSRRGRPRPTRSPTASRRRPAAATSALLRPLRLTRPIGWIGGR